MNLRTELVYRLEAIVETETSAVAARDRAASAWQALVSDVADALVSPEEIEALAAIDDRSLVGCVLDEIRSRVTRSMSLTACAEDR